MYSTRNKTKQILLHFFQFRAFSFPFNNPRRGFTLLEVLVATALLGIAVTVVLQLFSADLRALSISSNYVSASTKAEAKMREILDNDTLSEKSYNETTDDGYRMDIDIYEVLQERTETLQVMLYEIDLTIYWTEGEKEKYFTLRTMKTVAREI